MLLRDAPLTLREFMTEGVRVVEPVELAAMKAVSMVARQDRKGSRIDWIFTVCGGRSPS